MKKLNGQLAKLEKDVTEVKGEVEALKEHQETTDNEITELHKDIKEVKKSDTTRASAEQSDVLSEMKAREERKLNIIIHGMKEPDATEKPEIHRQENEQLSVLFQEMQINAEGVLEGIKFKSRLGQKQPGKHRPFLVKFHDRRVRDDLMRKAKNVRTGIRLKPDLTKKERDDDEKFKQMLDEENRTEPKDDSGDFRWKIAGPPGNLRKVKVRNIQEWEQAQQRRVARAETEE